MVLSTFITLPNFSPPPPLVLVLIYAFDQVKFPFKTNYNPKQNTGSITIPFFYYFYPFIKVPFIFLFSLFSTFHLLPFLPFILSLSIHSPFPFSHSFHPYLTLPYLLSCFPFSTFYPFSLPPFMHSLSNLSPFPFFPFSCSKWPTPSGFLKPVSVQVKLNLTLLSLSNRTQSRKLSTPNY